MEEREIVLLLHGLARTARSMGRMERALQRAGFLTLNISYPSRKQTIPQLVENFLIEAVSRCGRTTTGAIHFVTHSMGGILVRQYLATHTMDNPGRVVMLAPPNHGSEIVDRLGNKWWFKRFNGPAGCSLGTGPDSLPNRLGEAEFPLGIIAGDRSLDPVFSRMVARPNDGKVSVASARLNGMLDCKVVPHGHSFIMNRREVINLVVFFLRHGLFHT